MTTFARLLAPLCCLALLGCGASQGDDVYRRLFSSHNLLRHAGYAGPGPIVSGEVTPEQGQTLRARLARDTCYVLAAFGGSGLEDPGLTVVDPNEEPLAEDRGTGQTAVVSFCTERPGEHTVTVTAERGQGPFEVTYWYGGGGGEGQGPGGANALTLGRAVTGNLPPGGRIDYTLRVTQRRMVTIDLESEAFDAYLYLLRDEIELQRNDDGGSGLNSRIVINLEPGTYTVRVGSFMDHGSGPFTLLAR